VTLDGLINAIPETFGSFKLTFLGYFIMPIKEIHNAYFPFDHFVDFMIMFFIIASITILIVFYFFKYNEEETTSYRVLFLMFILGFFLFYIASFPAYVVHKAPNPLTFNSRLELLMPLGWSFMLIPLVMLITKIFKLSFNINKILFSFIASYYIVFNTITMLQFVKDNLVQQSIMINFEKNKKIKKATRLVIYDYNRYDHVYRRKFAWYEYNYLLKKVYGDQTRFATDYLDKRDISHFKKFITFPTYNFKDYKIGSVDYEVYIRDGIYKLTLFNTINMIYYKSFNDLKYKHLIKDIVNIQIK
jgi:hypothetical protein